jgi:Ni/Co efflux regulator RcnB
VKTPIFAACLLAATTLSSSLAWADPKDDRGGGQQGQGNRPAQAERPSQQQGRPQPQADRQPQTQRQAAPERQSQPQSRAQQQVQRNDQVQQRPQGQVQGQFQSQPQGRPQIQNQPRDQARAQAPRFSYGGRQFDRIRVPTYRYPQGYGYRRWGVGQDLPLLFLTSHYFFDSYASYGLGAPPYGYHWVRYGPDLLLVSDRSGRIRQVIYGAFY